MRSQPSLSRADNGKSEGNSFKEVSGETICSLFLSGLGVSWRTVLKEQSDQVARKEYSAKKQQRWELAGFAR